MKQVYYADMNKETTINESSLEVINLREKLRLFSVENRQIDSPYRIKTEVLNEFRNRSRAINLMTTDKRLLVSKVIHFDDKFLYVRIPMGFRIEPGESVIVRFPADENNYILQTLVHQIKTPVLCLRFLDPRKDRRYQAPENHQIIYSIMGNDEPILFDKRLYVLRKTIVEDDYSISLEELIGRFDGFNEKGEMIFRDIKRYTPVETMEGELINISRGGAMIAVHDEKIRKQSLIFTESTIELPDNKDMFCRLRLFGYVCNNNPDNTICIRFLKRIDTPSFEDILKHWAEDQM